MRKVFVFSGTSEGRELCEKLAAEGIECYVFVATEYGEAVMTEHPMIKVFVGRMDSEQIENVILAESPEHIIDATHPHAVEVTANIKQACQKAAKDKYIRVSREIDNSESIDLNDFIVVNSAEEAAKAAESIDGAILLTNGVKELHLFCNDKLKDRIIARILPGKESIEEALRCEIPTKNIVAMEGPFSTEMNVALIKQFNAKVMVTKNSGNRGGFYEKINACRICNIKAIVIDKPQDDSGMSVESAVNKVLNPSKNTNEICQKNNKENNQGNCQENSQGNSQGKNIYLIGAGVCDKNYLVPKAREVLENAEIIIGASRMVEFSKEINSSAQFFEEYRPDKVAEIINESDKTEICVVFSGDTGLCSGAKGVSEALKKQCIEGNVEIIPGISSISYFAAKTGIQYSDYSFVSMHGKECDISKEINGNKGILAICSGLSDVKKVFESCNGYSVVVGKNLGSSDEQIIKLCSDNISELTDGLYVIGVTLEK